MSVDVPSSRLGGVGDILHGSHWRLGSGGLRIVFGTYEPGCFDHLRPWEWQVVGQDRRLYSHKQYGMDTRSRQVGSCRHHGGPEAEAKQSTGRNGLHRLVGVSIKSKKSQVRGDFF